MQEKWLTQQEIRTLLDMLRSRHCDILKSIGENVEERAAKDREFYDDQGFLTGCDMSYERDYVDAVSEFFRIEFDILRSLPIEDFLLLTDEYDMRNGSEHALLLSPEQQRDLDDYMLKIERAGGMSEYLKKLGTAKATSKSDPPPPILKQKYR